MAFSDMLIFIFMVRVRDLGHSNENLKEKEMLLEN